MLSLTSEVSDGTLGDREDLRQVDGTDLFAVLLQPMCAGGAVIGLSGFGDNQEVRRT